MITTRLPHNIVIETRKVSRREAWITTVRETTKTILGNTQQDFGAWIEDKKLIGKTHLNVCMDMLSRIEKHNKEFGDEHRDCVSQVSHDTIVKALEYARDAAMEKAYNTVGRVHIEKAIGSPATADLVNKQNLETEKRRAQIAIFNTLSNNVETMWPWFLEDVNTVRAEFIAGGPWEDCLHKRLLAKGLGKSPNFPLDLCQLLNLAKAAVMGENEDLFWQKSRQLSSV
jgi:hypothetical protein